MYFFRLQTLGKLVKIMGDEMEEKKTERNVETEWMMVAMVIDRLMLICFFVLASLMTLIIFLNHPNVDDDPERFVDNQDPELELQKNIL